ncbi:MAG: hypothetical protein QOJ07_1523 [Thermoleophilaceae bacterium]|jgi:nitrogen fixation/metabolism regulation signal transduction histidine kinase|nr:hypothetical protein [Thermoleophilaceae bacterium]
MRRPLTTALLAIATTLVLAAPALANDNGEGLVGETDDKIITFFSLGLVVFFVLVTIIGSTIQGLLEKRKDAKKAARLRGRTGW